MLVVCIVSNRQQKFTRLIENIYALTDPQFFPLSEVIMLSILEKATQSQHDPRSRQRVSATFILLISLSCDKPALRWAWELMNAGERLNQQEEPTLQCNNLPDCRSANQRLSSLWYCSINLLMNWGQSLLHTAKKKSRIMPGTSIIILIEFTALDHGWNCINRTGPQEFQIL